MKCYKNMSPANKLITLITSIVSSKTRGYKQIEISAKTSTHQQKAELCFDVSSSSQKKTSYFTH